MGVLPDWMVQRDVQITPFDEGQRKPGLISSGLTSYGYDVRCGYKFKIFSPIGATEIDPKNFDPKALVEIDLTPKHNLVAGETSDGPCWTCRNCQQLYYNWKEEELPVCRGKENYILIPPHSFALAESLETFTIPRSVLCVVVGKSTYARCGLVVNVTPGEPDWSGKWTIELSNTTPLPIRVYAGEGIMQCIFIRSDGEGEAASSALYEALGKVDPALQVRMATADTSCRTSYADKKGKYQDQTGLTLPKVDKK